MKISIKLMFAVIIIISTPVYGASTTKQTQRFTVLDFFDRKIIVNFKIFEITESIHVVNKDNAPLNEDSHSCIVYIYKFNRKGSLISETLNRVGTDYGFIYDENNKLYDWTWKDKSTGETISFREELKDKPEKFKRRLIEQEKRVRKYSESYIPYTTKLIRTIADPCFGIEAEYEIVNKKTPVALPKSGLALKVKDIGRSGFKSPKMLYISYSYKYFE